MDLPTELYSRIFEQSKLSDRIEMSYVSKLFNQLNNRVEYSREIICEQILELPEYIVNVKLYSISEPPDKKIHFKYLDLRRFFWGIESFSRLNAPCLERLRLKDCISKDLSLIIDHIKSFLNLKELSICFSNSSDQYLTLIRELHHLKSLKLTFKNNVNDEELEILSGIDNIKRLKLINCNINNLNTLNEFKNLKRLELSRVNLKNFNTIEGLKIKELKIDNLEEKELLHLKRFPKLKSLIISVNVTTDIILLRRLKRLKKLELVLNLFVFGRVQVEIIKSLTNVKHLGLRFTNTIDSKEVHFLKKLKNLKYLSLHSYSISIFELRMLKSLKLLKIPIKNSNEFRDLIEVGKSYSNSPIIQIQTTRIIF
jgi:hypothetical protein